MSKYQYSFEDGGTYEQFQTNPNFPVTYHFAENLKNNITPAHWHEHIELLCVTQGELRIYVKGKVIKAFKGDLVVINPGETHAIPGRSRDSLYECLIPHKNLYSKMGIPLERYIIENHIQNDTYTQKWNQIMRKLYDKPQFYEVSVQLILLELLLELLQNHSRSAEPSKRVSESSGECMVKQAIKYMQENYIRPISTEDICQYLGFNKSYICNNFKQITGTTMISYLNMIRCEHARELLLLGKQSVSECASLSGFQHYSYFTKTYKRYMGELPSITQSK